MSLIYNLGRTEIDEYSVKDLVNDINRYIDKSTSDDEFWSEILK